METSEARDSVSVLIVEDDADLLFLLTQELKAGGHDVTGLSDPFEALDLIQNENFSVVIADQNMPGLNGLDFLIKLREVQPSCSRVLISGFVSAEVLARAVNEAEIFRFVPKPWNRAALLSVIELAAGRSTALSDSVKRIGEALQLNDRLTSLNATLRDQLNALLLRVAPNSTGHESSLAPDQHSVGLCFRLLSTFYPLLGVQAQAVVEACRAMSATEYFTESQRQVLMTSAWIYDAGLIALDRPLVRLYFSNPKACLSSELDLIANHPLIGQVVAAFVDPSHDVGLTVRAHHERFDGTGFPDRLAAYSIPWTARCLSVAVGFVQSGLSKEKAVEYLLGESGRSFDPEAVRLFVRSVRLSELPPNVREVLMVELRPGMTLAKGVRSTAGVLLMPEGHELSELSIAKLRSHAAQHLVTERLLIYA
jgi:response regulator RpfG family c-di-GMP phosphodiesterase